jgi:DNA polymerase-3 subunit alpha
MSDYDMNKRMVESLLKSGAMDRLGKNRSQLLASYETIIDGATSKKGNNIAGQLDFFSMAQGLDTGLGFDYPDLPEIPLSIMLMQEKEATGLYFSGHLIDSYSKHIAETPHDKISEILESLSEEDAETSQKYKDRSKVNVVGIITSKKTKIVKNGDTMAFITLDDGYGEIEVIVFAKSYKQYSDILLTETAVAVNATISTEEGEAPKLLLTSALLLKGDSEYSASKREASSNAERRIYIRVPNLTDNRINNINRICALNRGTTGIVLYDESRKKYCVMKDAYVDPSEKVISRLSTLFSPENVVFK